MKKLNIIVLIILLVFSCKSTGYASKIGLERNINYSKSSTKTVTIKKVASDTLVKTKNNLLNNVTTSQLENNQKTI